MLSPHDRTSLFEALRPPAGYRFESGVGTSFTLNLEALLTAPIAFALFDAEASVDDANGTTHEGPPIEPVGLLESIRRYSERLTVFCQAGQIALPSSSRTIYAWLEEVVVEATAPGRYRIFHPKVWVSRYRNDADGTSVLRMLCATRNLSFDTSLDTILAVDSDPYTDRPAELVSGQETAADFVASLPRLANRPLSEDRLRRVNDLAADIRHVPLIAPEPFFEMAFHSLGQSGPRTVLPDHSERAVVISPFVGETFLNELTRKHQLDLLLSRESTLDRIDPEILGRIGRVATLSPSIGFDRQHEGDSPGEGSERESAPPNAVVGGLHAKLFMFESDGQTRLFTGSANATDAAFDGNIEAMVELVGPLSSGVDALLEETPDEIGFDDLCIDYEVPDEPPAPDEGDDELTAGIDRLRHQIATAGLTTTVTATDDAYRLLLVSERPLPTSNLTDLSIAVWPITLFEDASAVSTPPGSRVEATFGVSLEGITSFFGIRVSALVEEHPIETTFVVNTPLVGAPDDRRGRLLAAMLRDPDRLLRYLILLLSDESDHVAESAGQSAQGWLGQWKGSSWDKVPLLELLVRAAQRHPERLDHIAALLDDLGEHRSSTVPSGFDSVWEPVWEYRRGQTP